jgi:outer membrane protein insertion porin family
MKAASSLLSVVSAAVMSVCIAASGSVAFQFAAVSVAQAATVNRIDVRGNQRVDSETIRNYIGIRPGVSFGAADIDDAVKRLFATGLFSDVRISQSGGALVVVVDEYAIVNAVIFQGNKKIKDDQLTSTVQVQPRGPFSQAGVDADVEAIKAAYARIGREDAVVTVTTQQVDGNRVNVIFQINEGGRTKIKSVNFVGNDAFGDGRLSDVISTKKSTILSFLSRNDVYDEARLRADEEALRRFYYNRGYADFQVISSYAELDPTENEYKIQFTLDEGEKYEFGDIAVDSSIVGIEPGVFTRDLETRQGRTYSAEAVEKTIIAITERLAGSGYAFAQVTPRGSRDFATRTISVLYTIDQGQRAYVERIEIRGNTRTRDYVIRREFDLSEGDAFNQVLIQRAKRRLEGLDFFESVEISTAPGNGPDQVVLVVDVVEKSTGELSIGAGYTSGTSAAGTRGFILEGGIGERNFLGRGQSISVKLAGGRTSRDFTVSFTEPYFLGRRISAGFDIFRQTRTYTNYNSTVLGGTVRFGLPITENLSTVLAYNIASDTYRWNTACDANGDGIIDPPGGDADGNGVVDVGCVSAPAIQAAVGGAWLKSSVSASLIYNTLDNMLTPTKGFYGNVTLEVAGIGGNARFVKATGRATYYHTLLEDAGLLALLAAGGGHVQAIGGGGLRVFDLFQSHDRMIRGFTYNGIGPVDLTTREQLGGTSYANATAELQFPIPGIPRSIGIKGAVFADAATVFGNSLVGVDATTIGAAIRASAGIGLIWASPFGPIRLDYAWPILRQPSDRVQNFNFGISTRF